MEQTDESARLAALCLAAGDRDRAAVRAAQAMREGAGLDEAIDAAGGVDLAALPDQDGRYRCPELRCPRRAGDAGFCGVYLEPMVAAPWEVAVVMGLPGPGRDAAIERCLRDAPQPVVTVRDADRPLRPYGPYRPGIGPTVVAELEEDVELGYHAIDRLLAAGRPVLIVTKYWLPGLRSRFERRAIHLLRAGPILPLAIEEDLEVRVPEEEEALLRRQLDAAARLSRQGHRHHRGSGYGRRDRRRRDQRRRGRRVAGRAGAAAGRQPHRGRRRRADRAGRRPGRAALPGPGGASGGRGWTACWPPTRRPSRKTCCPRRTTAGG